MKNIDINILRELMKNEKWADVIELVGSNPELTNTTFEVAYSAYKAFIRSDEKLIAELWVDKALSIDHNNTSAKYAKGSLCLQRGDYLEARSCLLYCVSKRPDVASYNALLGRVEYALGNYENAINSYKVAVHENSEVYSWWLCLGRAQHNILDIDEAISSYESALKLKRDQNIIDEYNELLRKKSLSYKSKEASSEYYDSVYMHSEVYQKEAHDTSYIKVWKELASTIIENKVTSILDLGCGPGQFAEYITKCTDISYKGIDFSHIAIERARSRCPALTFEQAVLPIVNLDAFSDFDCVVCTEVLEHIEDDLSIIKNIPKGKFFVGSVPNFDSFGHVRYFQSANDVRSRYEELIDNLLIQEINIGGVNIIWLMNGYKK